MSKIKNGQLKMRPKWYFVIGSILTFIGLVSSIASSVFAFGLFSFILRSNGRIFGSRRTDYLLSVFPWWLPVLAIAGTLIGVLLIRKYDFTYKIEVKKGIIIMILVVVASGFLIDILGFNDLLNRRGMMRGMFMDNGHSQQFEQKQNGPF
jgi:peptidoglycan biosynthesis protein MviN/MurJ (putative lipid II flippase)